MYYMLQTYKKKPKLGSCDEERFFISTPLISNNFFSFQISRLEKSHSK